jgi:hypothetical protein
MKAQRDLILIQIEIINESFPGCSEAIKNYKCALACFQAYQEINLTKNPSFSKTLNNSIHF